MVAESSVISTPVSGEARSRPSPEVVARAHDYLVEIQPWYWEFGSEVHNFYRETEKKMQQKGTNIALLLGDVRCGKTVERVKWEAEEPDRVVGCNLEGHGDSTDKQIINDILATIGEKTPKVLILDEVGYVKDRLPNVIDELTRRLPGIKIMAVLPLRLDEGNEVAQELEEFVESKKGLIENFPATWPKNEIARYFRRRCEMEGFSLDKEIQNQTISTIHYLCLGIPKSVEIATTELLTFLATRKGVVPEEISRILALGLAYYINPELEMEVPEEAVKTAGCFADISNTLYELVLKQMLDERFQQRKKQQEQLGAWYMLHSSLEKMGITVKMPDYHGIPAHIPPTEEVLGPVNVEEATEYILKAIRIGQCVSLTRFSPEDMTEVSKAVAAAMDQPVIHLDLSEILQQDSEAQAPLVRTRIAEQLTLDPKSMFDVVDAKRALKQANVGLIIFEGIGDCIKKQLPIFGSINGILRTLMACCPAISLGEIVKVPHPDSVGSPFFNVFTPCQGDFFRQT